MLRQNGLDYLNDPVQAIFTSNQGAVVNMVKNGEVDFGFVRTDQIEGMASRGVVELETFKFIDAVYRMSGPEQFPFPLTSTLYPEWNTGSLSHVDYRVQQAVQNALTQITGDHEAAQAGGYDGWRPTTSYMTLRDMQEELGVIVMDPADKRMKCVRQTTLYDSIICPPGYFKKSEAQVEAGCASVGKECPDGMQCVCKPCKRGYEVDVFQERATSQEEGCGKMTVCGVSRQRSPVKFRMIDRLNRPDPEISYFIHIGPGISGSALNLGNHTYETDIKVDTVGVHIIEFFIDGSQISESPMLFEIMPRDCLTEYGKNSLREPDGSGECVCKTNVYDINSKCVELWVIAISVALPVLALLLCCGCVYTVQRKKQNETYWRVKFSDLEFQEPPDVLGRGTFGLVLKGEYRGTTVAVKKVLPAKKDDNKRGGSNKRSGEGGDSMAGTNLSSGVGDGTVSMALTNHSNGGLNGNGGPRGPGEQDRQFSAVGYGNGLPEVSEEPEGMDSAGLEQLNGDEDMPSLENLQPMSSYANAPKKAWVNGEEVQIVPDTDTLDAADAKDPFATWRKQSAHSILWRSSPQGTSMASNGTLSGSVSQAGPHKVLMRLLGLSKDSLHEDFLHEMAIISRLRHPCITTVMGAVVEAGREPLLIMELMEHGSLYDLLRNTTLEIDGEIILPIVRDIAQGMNFLHQAKPPIIHGDIKSQNVLVDMRFRAKVSDFGLTQKKKVGLHGTPYFMAPELLQGESNTTGADVYAFAILLCEVYSRKDPYDGEDPCEVLQAVKDTTLVPPKRCHLPAECPDTLKQMIRQCWDNDKALRPTFQEIDASLRQLDATNVNPLGAMRSKQRSTSRLLYDVFPRHIADALAEGRKVEPESKDVVTIFFSDIVGFTNISATVPPAKVSNMLDRLYTTFDQLSREHVVFKVETIGDAYMAVTNLVEEQPDHAVRIARFSLDVVAAAKQTAIDLDDPSKGFVNIRVGFHSGPVVANVVGTRNPRYCLFGDTVNTASRMESNSIKGRIHMSQSAARCVRQQDRSLVIASRGWINVKGKGDMKTYWLLGESGAGARRRVLAPTSSGGGQEGFLGRTGSQEIIGRAISSAASLMSSEGGNRSSSHGSQADVIEWDGQSFNRAPSLDQQGASSSGGGAPVQFSNDAPRVPDMAVPETIGEEREGSAGSDAQENRASRMPSTERRRKLSMSPDARAGADLVVGDVVLNVDGIRGPGGSE